MNNKALIFVSSACVRHDRIKDSVEELARQGFFNIELSGGTRYYHGYVDDLLRLKDQYHLNYLLHNYFPPPQEDFILNLASLDEDIYQQSIAHYERAIVLSKQLGAARFGLHAGFFIDFTVNHIGRDIPSADIKDKDKAVERFCKAFDCLKEKADNCKLYIENNVLSLNNAKAFKGQCPFMLTHYQDYLELKERIDFNLLLDVAHLNVSAASQGLDMAEQLAQLIPLSDYVHLSDNDGISDQNRCFMKDSKMLAMLGQFDFKAKVMTSETYGPINDIKQSQAVIARSLGLVHEKD